MYVVIQELKSNKSKNFLISKFSSQALTIRILTWELIYHYFQQVQSIDLLFNILLSVSDVIQDCLCLTNSIVIKQDAPNRNIMIPRSRSISNDERQTGIIRDSSFAAKLMRINLKIKDTGTDQIYQTLTSMNLSLCHYSLEG